MLTGLLVLLWPLYGAAQDWSAAETKLQAAVDADDIGTAKTAFRQLCAIDSNRCYQLSGTAMAIFVPEDVVRTTSVFKSELRMLLRIHTLGMQADADARPELAVRNALLAMRFAAELGPSADGHMAIAVREHPYDSPLPVYTAWLQARIAAYQAHRLTLPQLALTWATVADGLLGREKMVQPEAAETARAYQRLSLILRATIPDCAQLMQQFESGWSPNAPLTAAQSAVFRLAALQQCDDGTTWDQVEGSLERGRTPAGVHRAAAARAMRAGRYKSSMQHWRWSAEAETLVQLKAADRLHAARVLALQGKYRDARTEIRKAMQDFPTWGDPYLQLVDLYLEGQKVCDLMSEFDRKALYWLAIDLCQQARNADANAAREVDRRIYLYRKRMPSREEAAFKGLSPGDTWPLRCWMSTVTTVK